MKTLLKWASQTSKSNKENALIMLETNCVFCKNELLPREQLANLHWKKV